MESFREGGAAMAGVRCRKCGAECPTGDAFCGECGARLPQRQEATSKEPFFEDRGLRRWGCVLWFLDLFPGLLSPMVLICSILCLFVSAAIIWFALLVFGMGGMIGSFFIGGFGFIVYWSALSWLLYGYVVFPSEALAEFGSRHWFVFVLATLGPIAALFYLAKLAMGQ